MIRLQINPTFAGILLPEIPKKLGQSGKAHLPE
jgi:hypothetical protein